MVAVRRRVERAFSPRISVDYDRERDVLYVALEPIVPAEGEDAPRGIVKRFAVADNTPVGVTVVGFRRNHWDSDVLDLADLITIHLSVSSEDRLDLLKAIKGTILDR